MYCMCILHFTPNDNGCTYDYFAVRITYRVRFQVLTVARTDLTVVWDMLKAPVIPVLGKYVRCAVKALFYGLRSWSQRLRW
jgi:hypothetical protein